MSNSLPKKRSVSKIIFTIFGTLFLFIFFSLAILPSVLSTQWGNEKILSLINSNINGKITFKNLVINWFGNQQIESLQLQDQSGKQVASIGSIRIESSLTELLLNAGKKGSFEISNLHAAIAQDSHGITNLQHLLSHQTYSDSDYRYTIKLSDVNGYTTLDKSKNWILKLEGKTAQEQIVGQFSVDANIGNIHPDKFFTEDRSLNTDQLSHIKISVLASNFPVRLLDEIFSLSDVRYKGLLTAAFGDTLNLNINEAKADEGIELKIKIQTPLLYGLINATLAENHLSINEPDTIEWSLQPKFIELLDQFNSSNYKVALKNATKGHLNIEKMKLAFGSKKKNASFIDLVNSYLTASFFVDKADIDISNPVGPISLQKLQLVLDASEKSDKIDLKLTTQASRDDSITAVNLSGILNKSFKLEELTSLKNNEFLVDLKGLPINLLDAITRQSNFLVDALGESLDAKVRISYYEEPSFTININSNVLKMDPLNFKMRSSVQLIEPVQITYRLPSSLPNRIALNDSSIKMKGDSIVKIDLKRIDIPATIFKADSLLSNLDKWIVDASLESSPISLVGFLNNNGSVQVLDTKAEISGKSLADNKIILSGRLSPAQGNNPMQHLLGNSMNLLLNLNTSFNNEGFLQIEDFTTQVKSSIAQLNFSGKIENGKLFLKAPATGFYTLSPTALGLLGVGNIKLDDSLNLKVRVDTNSTGINLKKLSELKLKGLLAIDSINLYGNSASIKNLELPWEIQGPSSLMSFKIKGITRLNSDSSQGSLDGNLQVNNWVKDDVLNFSDILVGSTLNLVNFPVAFFERISGQEDLIALMGSSINMNFQTEAQLGKVLDGFSKFSLSGQGLDGFGSFKIKDNLLTIEDNTSATINFLLTPERFQAVRKRLQSQSKHQPNIVLAAPGKVVLQIQSLSFALNDLQKPKWLKSSITSNFTIDELDIKDRTNNREVWLGDINGALRSTELQKNLLFTIDGKHGHQGSSRLPFSISGKTENTFTEVGQLNTDNLFLQIDSKFQKFPVKILAQFLDFGSQFPQRIAATLGDNIDADVHIKIDHLQGPVVMNLKGSNGSIDLDANINKGILTLNKNFYTKVNLTPEFGRLVLDDVFPLASEVVGSENPMVINIDPKNFSLPIKDFDISKVRIDAASLELGKVKFRSQGQLGTILSLFNTSRSDVLNVWFTPLYISMREGEVSFARMDMLLLDTYPIATWGDVNFASDRVNMIIGLTGQALKKSFNIQGLGSDYILQIPFKGTIDKASIDKKKATAKIAALVASNRGPEGLLIGTALHIASGGLTEQRAPSPTTNPLPWSTGDVEETPKANRENSPLHQVEDSATSILRNLIPF